MDIWHNLAYSNVVDYSRRFNEWLIYVIGGLYRPVRNEVVYVDK